MQPTHPLLSLYDQELRREISYPDMLREASPEIIRFIRPGSGMSSIVYSNLDESNADDIIAAQVDYFSRLNQSFNWKLYAHDHPADLGERLCAAGLEVDDPDAVMVLETSAWSSSYTPADTQDQLAIRQISDPAALSDVVTVLEAVWGGSFAWVHNRLGAHLDLPGYLEVYVAYLSDKPASISWIYFPQGSQFATLWAGTTLPQYRGLGLYQALLDARIQTAIHRGRRYVTVDAGPMSQPILARRGFVKLTTATDYSWQPSKAHSTT